MSVRQRQTCVSTLVRGPTHRSAPTKSLRLAPALLIGDLLDNDRQISSHSFDRDRKTLRRRVEQEHQLADQLLFRGQSGKGVNVFDVDNAAFDNAGFEFELRVL